MSTLYKKLIAQKEEQESSLYDKLVAKRNAPTPKPIPVDYAARTAETASKAKAFASSMAGATEEQKVIRDLTQKENLLAEETQRVNQFATNDGEEAPRNVRELERQASGAKATAQTVLIPKKYENVTRTAEDVTKPGIAGQAATWSMNFDVGRLSQEIAKATQQSIAEPTPENKKLVETLKTTYDKYIERNREAMFYTDKNGEQRQRGNALTLTFANYVPQLIDQIAAQVPAVIAAGAVGAATGGAGFNPTLKALGALTAGQMSYNVVRGSAYDNLLSLGIPEGKAKALSQDEAFKSTLVEMAEYLLSFKMLGIDKLAGAISGLGTKVVADLVAKTGKEALAQAALRKFAKALGAYGINILSEGLEEYVQEGFAIESEKKGLGGARTVTPEEDAKRKAESFKGGATIAAFTGGPAIAGTTIATNKILSSKARAQTDTLTATPTAPTAQENVPQGNVEPVVQDRAEQTTPIVESASVAEEAEVIGKGSMGEVVKIGDSVYKNTVKKDGTKTLEGEVYQALKGNDNVLSGEVVTVDGVEKIKTPYSKTIVSTDAIPIEKRAAIGKQIIPKNIGNILEAINDLSDKGYYYSDPLQFAFADNKLKLMDFSNVSKAAYGENVLSDNYSLLKNFLTSFGQKEYAEIISNGIRFKEVMQGITVDDIKNGDVLLSENEANLLTDVFQNGIKPENVYYTTNDRAVQIKGIAQTDKIGNAKYVFSEKPLSEKQIKEYELNKIYVTPSETTPSNKTATQFSTGPKEELSTKAIEKKETVAKPSASGQNTNAPLQLNINNAIANPDNLMYNTEKGGNVDGYTGAEQNIRNGIPGVQRNLDTVAQGWDDRRENLGVSGQLLLNPELRNTLNDSGVVDLGLRDSSNNSAAFVAALDEARNADKNGWAVSPQTEESLKAYGIKTYLSSDGLAGVGVKADGDITAVFKHPNKLVKGSSRDLMAAALANGGNKLDCYGSVLAGIYAQQGFIPVARVRFIDEYANVGWDESKGRPDIYFMMHNGDSVATVAQKFNQYPTYSQAQLDALPLMEYDDAYTYRDNAMHQTPVTSTQQVAPTAPKPLTITQAEEKKETLTKNATVGLNLNEYTGNLREDERRAIDVMGKVTKNKVIFSENVGTVDGKETVLGKGETPDNFQQQNGFYDPKTKTIFLNMDLEDKAFQIALHEVTHHIQRSAPEAYARYKSVALEGALKLWGDGAVERTQAFAERSAGIQLTTEQAQDEIVADYIGYIYKDPARITNLYTTQKSFAVAIKDALTVLVNKIKRALSVMKYSKAERADMEAQKARYERDISMWEKAFDAASRGEGVVGGDVEYSLRDSEGQSLTAQQAEFFKDSKVRDEQGNLLRVYHTTPKEFTVFSKEKLGEVTSGNTDDKDVIETALLGFWFSDKDLGKARKMSGKSMETYLNIKNPYSVYDGDDLIVNIIDHGGTAKDFVEWLEWRDYDGMVVERDFEFGGGPSYVAFSPEQIKSIDNKNPTENVDIRYSLRDGSTLTAEELEVQIADLRYDQRELQETLDDPFLPDIERKKAENELLKLTNQLQELVSVERKASVRTSPKNILDNLKKYRRSDLESLAEQVSDGNWDDYEELSRTELEDGIREILESQMEDLTALEAQSSKYGYYVRPAALSLRGAPTSPKTSTIKYNLPFVSTAPDGIIKRSDIEKFVASSIDRPVSSGKVRMRNVLGYFSVKSEAIRLKDPKNIPTLFHETGHFLDKRLEIFKDKDPKIQQELTTLGTPKSMPSYSAERVRGEGVAEFTKYYILDEQRMQNNYPNLYAKMEDIVSQDDNLKHMFEVLRTAIDNYRGMTPEQRLASNISMQDVTVKRKWDFDRLYTALFDDLNAIKLAVKEMTGGIDLKVDDDPYALATLNHSWQSLAQTYLESGFVDDKYEKSGKGLKEILDPIADKTTFQYYMVARRARELGLRQIKTGLEWQDVIDIIAKYDSEYAAPFAEVLEYQDNILRQLVKEQIISKEVYTAVKLMNQDYVPMYRVIESFTKRGTGKGMQASNPMRGIKGSEADIIAPLESIIKNTYLFTAMAEKNRIGLAFWRITENFDGTGKYMEKIPAPMKGQSFTISEIENVLLDAGLEEDTLKKINLNEVATIFRPGRYSKSENVITIYKDGKPMYFEVHNEDLYRALEGLDRESSNTLIKILSYPAKALRAGAILNPDFLLKNPTRDALTALIYSRYGFVPGFDTIRGLFHAIKKDKLYYQAMASGALQSSFVSMDRNYLQSSMKDLLTDSVKDKALNIVTNPLEALRMLSEFSESATRLGEFARGIEKYGSTREGVQRASLATREVAIDFARGGNVSKSANRAIAFFNSSLQGTDKMIREFKRDPFGMTLKSVAYITIPSLLLYAKNKDEPRYQELPDWQKDLFWIILTEDKIFRIPKPFELGVLFGSAFERIAEYIDKKDPKAFDGFGESLETSLVPGYLPTAMIPIIEALTNYSLFKQYRLVSDALLGKEPWAQYTEYTSETAKTIGKILNVSPILVENTIYGYGAGLAKYGTDIVDVVLKAANLVEGKTTPEKGIEELPLIKGFMAVAYRNAASINEFYDLKAEISRKINTYDSVDPKLKLQQKQLEVTAVELGKIRKQIDAIYGNPRYTAERQKELIDKLNIQMVNLARRSLGKDPIKN